MSPSTAPSRAVQWPPRLYIAIDCGGTKATAAICNQNGELVGRGRGGPANYIDIGLQMFLQSVAGAVKSALYEVRMHYACMDGDAGAEDGTIHALHMLDIDQNLPPSSPTTVADALRMVKPPASLVRHCASSSSSAGADPSPPYFHSAWLGIAGVDSPTDVTALSPHVADLLSIPYPSQRLIVANDTSLLASPIANPARPHLKSGVVVIAGTGSIVMSFRRRRNGMLKVLGRVGGFGWLLGDEGSGYSVGRAAVRQVLDLADRERLDIGKGGADHDDTPSDSEEEDEDNEEDGDETQGCAKIDKQATIRRHHHSGVCSSTGIDHPMPFPMDGNMQKYSLHDRPPALETLHVTEAKAAYGQLLRDRILQHWRLHSTDELLRAVYFGDEVQTVKRVGISGTAPKSMVIDTPVLSTSGMTLRDVDRDDVGQAPTVASDASANLLPPLAPPLTAAARMRLASPIPSLSSSPSPTSAACSEMSSTTHETSVFDVRTKVSAGRPVGEVSIQSAKDTNGGGGGGGGRGMRKHSDSITSAGSSFYTTSVGSTTPPVKSSSTERKHRLASLAPLVFHLAFSHQDALSLHILRSQARLMAMQVCELVRPTRKSRAHLVPEQSVLCLGGSLVGVQRYRGMLIEQLAAFGIDFAHVEFVDDPARHGATALANISERAAAAAAAVEEGAT